MKRIMISKLNNYISEEVKIEGWVYRIRSLKTITFLILRDRTGLVQCVIDNKLLEKTSIKLESVISIIGYVKESNNKLNKFEIEVNNLEVISYCKNELLIEINKEELNINLETMLNNRILSLRHEKINL